MSGGHWGYRSERLKERGDEVRDLFLVIAEAEHELDWGICGDSCLTCAKLRVAEGIIRFLDGDITGAIAAMRDVRQNRCGECASR